MQLIISVMPTAEYTLCKLYYLFSLNYNRNIYRFLKEYIRHLILS